MMLIHNHKGILLGSFYFNDEVWSGTAAKSVWNIYMSMSRTNKKHAELFAETMKYGGSHSGYVSSNYKESKVCNY